MHSTHGLGPRPGEFLTKYFEDFNAMSVKRSFTKFVEFIKKHPYDDVHWMPVAYRCKPDKLKYDYVLRIDDYNLLAQLSGIFKCRNWKEGISIKAFNVHLNHNYDALIDFYRESAKNGNISMEDLIESVHQIYRRDIEIFNYSFPPY